MIQVFQPTLGPEEQAAVSAVLASGWIGFGPKVREFEQAWAAHIGVPAENVVSVSCATEGLYQIFDHLGTWANDRRDVIMPAISFIGIANAVSDAALNVVLCDVDCRTLNPTVDHILSVITEYTRAVCIQHYGGVPSDLGPIAALCRLKGVALVEDCACAPLSFYDGHRAGTFGDFAVWSFDSMKIITSGGDGGMIYCRDARVAEQLRMATRLGQDSLSGQASSGPRWWEFTVARPGRKAMMNDLQAAVGLEQIKKLPALVERRAALWGQYQSGLCCLEWLSRPPEPEPDAVSAYYTYWVQTRHRDTLAAHLRECGIYTTFRYWPVNRAYGWAADGLNNSEWAADHTLNLPLHANLTEVDIETICAAIREFGEKTQL